MSPRENPKSGLPPQCFTPQYQNYSLANKVSGKWPQALEALCQALTCGRCKGQEKDSTGQYEHEMAARKGSFLERGKPSFLQVL